MKKNHCWHKINYQRTSKNLIYNLCQIIRQPKKVGSNSSLYSNTKKWQFFERKKCKSNKIRTCFKGFTSSYNVEMLNSFNPELQLKDTESTIKGKAIELLTQLRDFKFVTTLALVFK